MSDLLGDVDRGAIVYFDGWIHENDSTLREVRKESDSPQGFSKILRRRIKEEDGLPLDRDRRFGGVDTEGERLKEE